MKPSASYKPFFAVAFLAVVLGFVHATLVSGQRDLLNTKVAAWQAEQGQIDTLIRMKRAHDDLARFRATLPEQTDLPKIVAFVSETAEAYRLPIPSVAYDHEETDLPGLTALSISFDVTGDYLDIRRFIDALEQSDHFFLIEQLALTTSIGEMDADRVRLQIRIAAYMRRAEALERSQAKRQPERIE